MLNTNYTRRILSKHQKDQIYNKGKLQNTHFQIVM